jgi:hypothetical protein
MFGTIIGMLVALVCLGLPLAIIVMFVLSILDQRNKRTSESDPKLTRTGRDGVVVHVDWSSRSDPRAGHLTHG